MKKILLFFLTAVSITVVSCTKEKTDYEAELGIEVTEYYEFKEAAILKTERYQIRIEALNGTFYKGYNEIRLKIMDSRSNDLAKASELTFLPITTNADGSRNSCPHQYDLTYQEEGQYFSGYVVFTGESKTNELWEIYINGTLNNNPFSAKQTISVQQQTNKNLNMVAFTGKDDEQYFIALVSPQKPKIAENKLVAGIYKFNKPTGQPSGNFPDPSQFSYTSVSGYTLQLDPRMPEPSMGNHSSINNKDLVQESDGFYQGIVNYTMTGNWTLNFILLNKSGQILNGTVVPKDFTPGIEGTKSELFIDILF